MSFLKLVATAIVLAGSQGCATRISSVEGQTAVSVTLGGSAWALIDFNGRPIGSLMTIRFDDARHLSGLAGCNSYSGGYTVEGSTLIPGEIVQTVGGCEYSHRSPLERSADASIARLFSHGHIPITHGSGLLTLREGRNLLRFGPSSGPPPPPAP